MQALGKAGQIVAVLAPNALGKILGLLLVKNWIKWLFMDVFPKLEHFECT